MAAYAGDGDETETNTDQAIKQKNVGSGDSVNINCAQNLIEAGVGQQCGNDGEIIIGLPEVPRSYDSGIPSFAIPVRLL